MLVVIKNNAFYGSGANIQSDNQLNVPLEAFVDSTRETSLCLDELRQMCIMHSPVRTELDRDLHRIHQAVSVPREFPAL